MTTTNIAVQKNETFCFDSNQVRVLVDQEETVWFVAKDVAQALAYRNSREAIQYHCKQPKLLKSSKSLPLNVPPRGITIINRRDVFRLIMKSHLPEAERFEEWVWDVIESVPSESWPMTLRTFGSWPRMWPRRWVIPSQKKLFVHIVNARKD